MFEPIGPKPAWSPLSNFDGTSSSAEVVLWKVSSLMAVVAKLRANCRKNFSRPLLIDLKESLANSWKISWTRVS